MIRFRLILIAAALTGHASAQEVTLQNDSLTDFGEAVIVTGFIAGGGAGSWLTSPCSGDLVAAQVFWRSQSGTGPLVIHDSIRIYRSGVYPDPGALAETIAGPVLTDGVLNEWRHLDENQVIPLSVPIDQDETVVVAIIFDEAPPAPFGPSVVRDVDGIEPQSNTIYSNFGSGFEWRDAGGLGVTGDWVIRAVVDCDSTPNEADISVTMSADPPLYTDGEPLDYTIVVANSGPATANGTTVLDIFPAAYTGPTWTCSGTGGGACNPDGAGNINQLIDLPPGGEVTFSVSGMVAPGTSAPLENSATAVVPAGVVDPHPDNNTATVITQAAVDPEADVSVNMSADPLFYTAGEALTYTIVVANAGPDSADGTGVTAGFPSAYTDVNWTCGSSGGANCDPDGVGDIDELVDLPPGGEITFSVNGIVAPGTSAPLENSATAVVPSGVVDPNPDNNTATVVTEALVDPLFEDRFED